MNNALLTILTIIGSAGCALTGILVNRKISLRQLETAEAGNIITNAEYWRKEVDTFKTQISQLREELVAAKQEVDGQAKDIEALTFRYYAVVIERDDIRKQLEMYEGRPIRKKQIAGRKEDDDQK